MKGTKLLQRAIGKAYTDKHQNKLVFISSKKCMQVNKIILKHMHIHWILFVAWQYNTITTSGEEALQVLL